MEAGRLADDMEPDAGPAMAEPRMDRPCRAFGGFDRPTQGLALGWLGPLMAPWMWQSP